MNNIDIPEVYIAFYQDSFLRDHILEVSSTEELAIESIVNDPGFNDSFTYHEALKIWYSQNSTSSYRVRRYAVSPVPI